MNKNNVNKNKKVYIRPEDALEFVYELTFEWEKSKIPISKIREEIRPAGPSILYQIEQQLQ